MIIEERAEVVWAVVVAAGSGSRFGTKKQFLDLGGQRVVDRAVRIAAAHSRGVVVVLPADAVDSEVAVSGAVVVAGADSRSGSVRCGLAAVPHDATVILIHDGARPLASDDLYERVVASVAGGADAVVPVVAVTDTIRHRSSGVVDRGQLVAVQTPQGFRASVLRAAHQPGEEATDDATLVEACGARVVLVDGERDNIKITDPSDLEIARLLLARSGETP